MSENQNLFKPALWRVLISLGGSHIWVTMGGPRGEGEHAPAFCLLGPALPLPYTIEGDDRTWHNFTALRPTEAWYMATRGLVADPHNVPAFVAGEDHSVLSVAEARKLETKGQAAWAAVYGSERPDWKPLGYIDGRLVPHGQG